MKFPRILCGLAITSVLILISGCGGGAKSQISIGQTPDFSLTVTAAQAWTGGGSGNSTITVAVGATGNFAGTVTLTITGASFPAGVSGAFNNTSVTAPSSATFTITSTGGKPPSGNYPFTIVGTSGSLTHSAATSLFVPGPIKMEALIPPGGMESSDAAAAAIGQYIQVNPVVTGGTFQVEWSSIDQGPAAAASQYNWAYSDGLLQQWSAAGKQVNFIFWANSDSGTTTCSGYDYSQYGQDGTGNCAIPTYVWSALGASNYTTCTPSNSSGPQQIPNYFATAFQSNYQAFIKAAIAHYASNSSIGYLRFGLGRGGETIPVADWDTQGDPCSTAFTNWGLTDSTVTSTWQPYLQTMMDFEAANNPSGVQLLVGITPMNTNGSTPVPDFVANTAVPLGIGFGSQGFQQSDMSNPPSSCTADWCNLFNEYTGQVPLELQTVGQSCINANSCATGSLVTLLPFAVDNKATILEIYYQDWLTAFDPNYSPYDSSGGYATALTNAAAGNN
jgi:hypothetical protein